MLRALLLIMFLAANAALAAVQFGWLKWRDILPTTGREPTRIAQQLEPGRIRLAGAQISGETVVAVKPGNAAGGADSSAKSAAGNTNKGSASDASAGVSAGAPASAASASSAPSPPPPPMSRQVRRSQPLHPQRSRETRQRHHRLRRQRPPRRVWTWVRSQPTMHSRRAACCSRHSRQVRATYSPSPSINATGCIWILCRTRPR